MKVRIQTIRVWIVEVDADTKEEAISKAYGMSIGEIEKNGDLENAETDYAEVEYD